MSAPMQGEMQPAIYRLRLGSFEVASILDSKIIREGLSPSHGGEALSAEVRALARANRIDPHRYEHPFIPSLVNTGKELSCSTPVTVRCSSSTNSFEVGSRRGFWSRGCARRAMNRRTLTWS